MFFFCLKVQGMSFIAAVLLLNMDVADAFVCFANLLNRPCQVTFFRVDESLVSFGIVSGPILQSSPNQTKWAKFSPYIS